MPRLPCGLVAIAVLAMSGPRPAAAQSSDHRVQVGVQVAAPISSEFDRADVGVGGRLSWHPAPLLGLEAEVDLYPRDFAGRPAFSRGRIEGLFGATVGPRLGAVRPFARLRAGFLTFREAPEPLACILIFPPPLACELAGGRTVPAYDVGGGIELFTTARAFLRIDVGDRLLKYPGPVFDSRRRMHDRAFLSHDFRFAAGGGLRF